MGPVLRLRYPHCARSLLPSPMKAATIWAIAESARGQLFGLSRRLPIEVGQLIARCGPIEVNRLRFEVHWECGQPLTDGAGQPVLGVTEHDRRVPEATMISLNGAIIGDRAEVLRSTALHELGHAIFDAPSWVAASDRADTFNLPEAAATMAYDAPGTASPVDWREWRANEFMGAFLAPRALLHRQLERSCAALGVPLRCISNRDHLPVLDVRLAEPEAVDALVFDLAERFGLTEAFLTTRLHKYRLMRGT